jgi:hypothetical protein
MRNFLQKGLRKYGFGMMEDAFMESRYQLQHDKNHEYYQNIPTSYYDQGGWEDYPSWFSS